MARILSKAERDRLSKSVISGIRNNIVGPSRRVTSDVSSMVIRGSMDDMNNLFGKTSKQYMDEYENIHKMFLSMLDDPKRLSRSPGTEAAVARIKRTGEFNLSVLTRQSAESIRAQLAEPIERMMLSRGFPGLDIPSTNLYRNTVRFDLDMTSAGAKHPLAIILNNQHFNINPNGNVTNVIRDSFNKMLTPTQLRSAMNQVGSGRVGSAGALNPFGKRNKNRNLNMLILDTETTGVDEGRVARSIATLEATMDRTGNVTFGPRSSNKKLFLRQPGLEGGVIQTPTGMRSLAEGANILEGAVGSLASIDVVNDSAGAQKAMNDMIQYFLQYDRIIAKNADFDVSTIIQTARNLPGAANNQALMASVDAFEKRAYSDASFVSNIDISLRAHLKAKFDDYADNYISQARAGSSDQLRALTAAGIDVADEAEIRNFLYAKKVGAKELFESLEIGKSGRGFTPSAMNNLIGTTNLLELIHQDAFSTGPNSGSAKTLYNLLSGGSHVAETDDYLAGFVAQYVQTGRLDFDTGSLNHLPVGRANFVRMTRKKIAQSASPTMTTNIADVDHLTKTARKALKSAEAREILGTSIRGQMANVMTASQISELAAETGLSEDALRQIEGKISYSKGAKGYVFSTLDDRVRSVTGSGLLTSPGQAFDTSFRVSDRKARSYMGNVVNAALSGTRDAVQRDAAFKFVTTGLDYSDQGMLERAAALPAHVRSAISGFNINAFESALPSMDRSMLVDALTNTSRMMATEAQGLNVALSGGAGTNLIDQNLGTIIRRAMERGDAGMYARIAANIGNPFASADITERIFSVEMAKRTASVAKAEAMSLRDTSAFSFMRNMDILSEFGVSAFNVQDITQIVRDQDLVGGKLLVGQDILSQMKLNVAAPGGGTPITRNLVDVLTDSAAQVVDTNNNIISTGAEFNKVRFSTVQRDSAATVNAFLGGEGVHTRAMSQALAESLYDASMQVISTSDLTGVDEELADISKQSQKQLRSLAAYLQQQGTREQAVESLTTKIHEGGIGFSRITGQAAESVTDFITQSGAVSSSGNDIAAPGVSRLVGTEGNVVLLGHAENSAVAAVSSNNTMAQQAASAVRRDQESLKAMKAISEFAGQGLRNEILEEEKSLKLGKVISARQRQIRGAYQTYKKPVAIGVGALLAAGVGYYSYKKIKEAGPYDDVMDRQQTDPARAPRMDILGGQNQPIYSRIQDPLATAGVVGNLDRAKIGHTKMGSNKYDSLFAV
jgi:hypothetical protein